jgi:hypothetical protein
MVGEMRGLTVSGVAVAIAIAFLLTIEPGCGGLVQTVQEAMKEEPPFSLGLPDSSGLVIVNCRVLHDPHSSISFSSDKSFGETIMEVAFEGLATAIFGPDPPEDAAIRGGEIVGEEDRRVKGEHTKFMDHAVVFPNLPSGQYRLTKIEADYDLGDYERAEYYECGSNAQKENSFYSGRCPDRLDFELTLPADAAGTFDIEVERGELVYVGKIVLVVTERPPFRSVSEESHIEGGVLRKTYVDEYRGRIRDEYAVDPDPEYEIEALADLIRHCEYYEDSSWIPLLRERLTNLRQALPPSG